MKRKKEDKRLTRRLLCTLAAALFAAHCAPVAHASAWETAEYFASNGLDLINAAAAYEQGYTGRGVTIGVCDQPINFDHPEFSGKNGSSMLAAAQFTYGNYLDTDFEPPGVYDWSVLWHGTHVAAIAAGSRDGAGMHGAAFDADVAGAPFGQYFASDGSGWMDEGHDIYGPYRSMADVKIISNSWGINGHLDEFSGLADFRAACADISDIRDFLSSIRAMTAADKLMVFAADNAGCVDPMLFGAAGLLDKNTARNLISVTALSDTAMRDRTGGIVSGRNLMYLFSNLAAYAEDITIAARGVDILSANANFAADGQRGIVLSGTSQAVPFVGGGAALVQQAFPYLGGRQIGDVLLSTANPNVSVTNGYVVVTQNPAYGSKYPAMNIFYTDPSVTSKTQEQKKADVEAFVRTLDPESIEAEYFSLMFEHDCPINAYYQVPMQALVGQGVLDLG